MFAYGRHGTRQGVGRAAASLACNQPAAASRTPPSPSRSAPLLSLFSTLRLVCLLEAELNEGLESVSALLGCPYSLFDAVGRPPCRLRLGGPRGAECGLPCRV